MKDKYESPYPGWKEAIYVGIVIVLLVFIDFIGELL